MGIAPYGSLFIYSQRRGMTPPYEKAVIFMRNLLAFFLSFSLMILPVQAEETKYVALTFDDGPSGKYTRKLLDGLYDRGVQATFLLCGYRM